MYCGDSQIGTLRIIATVFFLTLPYIYIYIVKKLLSIELFSDYHRNGCKYYSQLICHRVEIGRTVKNLLIFILTRITKASCTFPYTMHLP